MIASELIEQLNSLIKDHGDLEVNYEVSPNHHIKVNETKVKLIEPRDEFGKRLYSVKKIILT